MAPSGGNGGEGKPGQRQDARSRRMTTDFEVGVFEVSAVESSGIRTFVSGK
jgi:hypothetical protein